MRSLGRISRTNHALTAAPSALLAGPAWLRRLLVEYLVTEGASLARLLADEGALDGFVRDHLHGIWHASGTCRMGAAEDPAAVTDVQGRVHGVQGLRVVDASLMPVVPRANTKLPTPMMAQKIAGEMLREPAGGVTMV